MARTQKRFRGTDERTLNHGASIASMQLMLDIFSEVRSDADTNCIEPT